MCVCVVAAFKGAHAYDQRYGGRGNLGWAIVEQAPSSLPFSAGRPGMISGGDNLPIAKEGGGV